MSREALIQNPPFFLTSLDIATLRQTDEQFTFYTWQDLKALIATNTLDGIVRTPSDLENYIHFTHDVKSSHGSMAAFILQHKLRWLPIDVPSSEVADKLPLPSVSPIPFACTDDYKISRNDWPYGTTRDINHLVVWLKTSLMLDEEGEPTDQSRGIIEQFVQQTFREKMGGGEDCVVWFRNPTKWQTVRALEHFHVFVRGADEKLLESWTGQMEGDMESRKWRDGKRLTDSLMEDSF